MSVVKVVKVYFDYPEYMKPKEITKVFKLYDKAFAKNPPSSEKEEAKAELLLLLNVITAAEDLTYRLSEWTNSKGKKVGVLQILETVSESMFDKGQDD